MTHQQSSHGKDGASFTRIVRVIALAGAFLAVEPVVLFAQQENNPPSSNQRPNRSGLSGVRSAGPRPMKLGGVKAAGARPIKSLGGVKSKGPRPIGSRGSLLPPKGTRTPTTKGEPTRPLQRVPGTRFQNDIIQSPGTSRPGRIIDGDDRFRGGVNSNGGLRVRGSFDDGDFRGRVDINPGGVGDRRRRGHHGHDHDHDHGHDHDHHHHHRFPGYWPWYYGGLFGYGRWYDRYDYYPPETVTSSPIIIDASMLNGYTTAPPAPPPPPPTELEIGDSALYNGRIDDAIKAYREHLDKTPEDAYAMRSLAVALVQDKKVKEGVALLSLAYEKDLSLVRKPIEADMLADGDRGLHDVLLAVVPYSNRTKSASGYLTVTVLMQAQDREPQALKILERAKKAGLDERVAAELEAELGG